MTTLNIRIDEKLKNNAADVLGHMGLDLSSAIKMFLNQVIVKRGIPFTPTIVDEFGDTGYNTVVDFRDENGKGVDAEVLLKALEDKIKNDR